MPLTLQVLDKIDTEIRLYGMDFDALLEDAETISTIVSVTSETPMGATDLAIAGQSISGTKVQFNIGGGTANHRYRIGVEITTSLGNTLAGFGQLRVIPE